MSGRKPTIIYVTREIERALGMAPHENYRIVTNHTSYGEDIARQYPKFVTLLGASSGAAGIRFIS